MGQGTKPGETLGKISVPNDTENTIYFVTMDGQTINERVQNKWPSIHPFELTYSAKWIKTDNLDSLRYDPRDWKMYVAITASLTYFQRTKKT